MKQSLKPDFLNPEPMPLTTLILPMRNVQTSQIITSLYCQNSHYLLNGHRSIFKCLIFIFILTFICLFIYLWLCWVFVSVRGLSLAAASGRHSSSRCAGLSLSQPLLRSAGSVIVAHGPSCSAACGIFPDQGSNPCPLHWQADSQPLRHQGSPKMPYF